MRSDRRPPVVILDVDGTLVDSAEGSRISERHAEIFRTRYLPHIRPFPRVRDLVERFARDGFTIVIASSAKKEELAPLLEIAGVLDLITAHTSSDDAERSKPDPDIVRAALHDSGAAPDAAIMLGDTPYDVEAARRAGIEIVGFECGGWRREELQGATAIYPDPAALCALYEGSPVARLKDRTGRGRHPTPARAPSVWWLAAPLLILGAALVVGAVHH